ncbi:hypothetical protein A4G19_07680 [Pasteurellaceae bacterium Macca]|nr:hypothetical protein [Pasteurellaceae bacterium Macca]
MKSPIFLKSTLTMAVAFAISSQYVLADEDKLNEIKVVGSDTSLSDEVGMKKIQQRNPSTIKELFADSLDVSVNDLQRTRSGNEGINVRGLQGNRVGMSVDGISLPEAQESKLFAQTGIDFGRGNFIEPTALQSAQVTRSGSATGLSASVDFRTLEPSDILKNRPLAGFVATGYHSVDKSTFGTVGFAAQNAKYQGLLLTNYRKGNETKTQGNVGGIGATRTEADPASHKGGYVLVKNYVQANENHRVGLVFEHFQRKIDTNKLSSIGQATSHQARNNILSDNTFDQNSRNRISLSHHYSKDNLEIKTTAYYQGTETQNYRARQIQQGNMLNVRSDSAMNKEKAYGLRTDVAHYLEGNIIQVLRYGLNASYKDLTNQLVSTARNPKPSADTKQTTINAYVEDEITLGKVSLTPHLGVVHYRLNPSDANGYVQRASHLAPIQKQRDTQFLPKFTALWHIADEFKPYAQYSRGFKAPSAQQLTTSFGNSGRGYNYSIVGNPRLKPETADNIELGFKGKSETLSYRVAGFYNRYRHFIDYRVLSPFPNMNIQYDNIAKAKIYGVEADAKWQFYGDFSVNGGVAYSRGRATDDNGTQKPINTIQPLKLKAGFAYDSEMWGANATFTYVRGKANKDIDGTMYNPSESYNLVDFGLYYKPIKDLTLSVGLYNAFNKKYWNWADISHFAGRDNQNASYDRSVGISPMNADAYTAPGRHFNVGLRYEF